MARLFLVSRTQSAVAVFLLMAGGPAGAQWTVASLGPVGVGNSYAYAVSGPQQAGVVQAGGIYAALWSGSAASWVNLNPAGSTRSEAYANSGVQQGGDAIVGGHYHASLWSGSAASWVDLHPASASDSYVYA